MTQKVKLFTQKVKLFSTKELKLVRTEVLQETPIYSVDISVVVVMIWLNMTTKSSDQTEIHEIDLDLLDRDEVFQFRSKRDGEEVESLKASIASEGQLAPIIVRTLPSGRFQLVSGYRRSAALLQLGRMTAKAVVWHQMSDEQATRVALAENLVRESLSEWDQVRTAHHLRRSGMSKQKVAEAFKVSTRTIERYCAVAKAPPEFQKALAESRTTIMAVHTAITKGIPLEEVLEGGMRGRSVRYLQTLSRSKKKKSSRPTVLREHRDGSLSFSLRYTPGDQNIAILTKEVAKLLSKLKELKKRD